MSDQPIITMDWLPTLVAAAGTRPDPAYPSDGEDLAPALSSAPAHPRKFYWRYKAGSQRAVRDGDFKYLRIAGNEFLFDVAQDPRERGNLRERRKDVFDRLKGDWEAWNGTMLGGTAGKLPLAGQCHGGPLRRRQSGAPTPGGRPAITPRRTFSARERTGSSRDSSRSHRLKNDVASKQAARDKCRRPDALAGSKSCQSAGMQPPEE